MAYLTSKELLDRFKIKSQTTLWRWQKPTQKVFNAPFPPPVKVSVGSTSQSLLGKTSTSEIIKA